MATPVVYRRQVGRDLAAGFSYYETQGGGLGDKFLAAVEASFDAIEDYPRMFSKVHGEVRRAILSGFPYAVFYRVDLDQIVVLTVLHTSRDPRAWPGR